MSSATSTLMRPDLLAESDQETAATASRVVARLAGRGAVRVEAVPVDTAEGTQTFVLPAAAVRMLADMLVHLGAGSVVSVIPDHAELTTQQAADFLNVSRPWVVKLIERNEIPHHMVGTHRRVLFGELRAYRERLQAIRRSALDALTEQAQVMGDY